MRSLAAALHVNKTLEELYCSPVSTAGAITLARSLLVNRSLRIIEVSEKVPVAIDTFRDEKSSDVVIKQHYTVENVIIVGAVLQVLDSVLQSFSVFWCRRNQL